MADQSSTYLNAVRLIGRVLDGGTRESLMALLPILMNKEPVTMADIVTALADLDAAVKGVATRNDADVTALKAEIETLKAAGVNTAQLQAVATSIETQAAALNAIEVPAAPAAPAAPAPVDPAPAAPAAPVDPAPAAPVADPAPAAPVDPAAPAAPAAPVV